MASKSGAFSIGASQVLPVSVGSIKAEKDIERWSTHDCLFPFDKVFTFGIGKNCTYVLSGLQGTGKTTFCLQHMDLVVSYNKRKKLRALYITNEQQVEELAIMCARLGVKNVDVAHLYNIDDIVKAIEPYHYIVIDSIQGVRVPNEKNETKEAVFRINAIAKNSKKIVGFITHLTKDGKSKGDSGIGHVVDGVMKIHRGNMEFFREMLEEDEVPWNKCNIVEVQKMRFSQTGFLPMKFDGGKYDPIDYLSNFPDLCQLPRYAFERPI